MTGVIQAHNQKSAATSGAHYEDISRGIADSIEHCVLRLGPKRGERILDLATGTGWTSRVIARRGANVTGVDIREKLIETAIERTKNEKLDIAYEIGDAESLPFEDGEFDAVNSTCGVLFASK